MDLETFLRKALANNETIDVGKFQLLNMKAVEEHAGDAWPQIRKKIFSASTHFIEKRITANDCLVACNEGFLLIFADPETDADTEIEQISIELQAFFLGTADLQKLSVEWETDSMTAQDFVKAAAPQAAEAPKPVPIAPEPVSEVPKAEEKKEEPTPMTASYQPYWDAEKQSIFANKCFAKYYIEGRQLDGRRVIETRMAQITHQELDAFTIKKALETLISFFKAKKPLTLCLSLHSTSLLTEQSRTALLQPLTQIPPQIRKAFLVKIEGLNYGAKENAEIYKGISKLGLRIMAEIPFETTDLASLNDCGISVISIAAPQPSNELSEGMLDHETKALNNLVKEARSMKIFILLDEVNDLKALKAAMTCGVRFVGGTSVVAASHRPVPNKPLSVVDLYRINKAA